MKRFITINAKDRDEVLILMRNAVITAMAKDAYEWLKKQLQQNQVGHHDQTAHHQSALPHQGGYVSFYVDDAGKWMYVSH